MTDYRIKRYRRFLYMVLAAGLIALMITVYIDYWKKVPSTIKIRAGVEQELDFRVPASGEIYQEEAVESLSSQVESIHVNFSKGVTLRANQIDHYTMDLKLFGILPYKSVDIQVIQDTTLIPSGLPIGIYVKTDGVLVVGIGEFENPDGETVSPARYILQSGDYILDINGEKVENKKQFVQMIADCEGEELIMTLRRQDEITEVKIKPEYNQSKEWKLGIWIRDNAQGIGTLTYVDTDDTFGALGHGINDVDTSTLMRLEEGTLYKTEIVGITRGTDGSPGELTGYIAYDSENIIGEITENTAEGIFGVCKDEIVQQTPYEAIPIALKQEVQIGPAQIICSVTGEPGYYDIEIMELHLEDGNVNRGLVIKITDEELLQLTGGIIQGMSGSPIIQNGKLVGAVTHVLVQDAASGYGIFIENMLVQ
ncbi:MAG: SpoIVB peptidase [Bacillus sp. (in: Bacteria)]|nr:SpoIVB peptidase [Bacillus sp. (in: firmicutes)]MCM1425123.1 SpoIVB peptidase [Eubacterium sp.]